MHVVSTCDDAPARTTIIGVNGGPGLSHAILRPLLALAADDRCIVLYDQRGTGLSPPPPDGDYSIDAHVDDLAHVIGDRERVIVFGTSWGGVVATAYAQRHPERVRGLVLVNPGALSSSGMRDASATFNERVRWLRALEQLRTRAPSPESCRGFRRNFPAYFFDPDAAPPFPDDLACADEAAAATWTAIRDYDLTERGAITVPVLLVRGEGEAATFGDTAKNELVAMVDPSLLTIRELARCGHSAVLDCPDAVKRAIADWLALLAR